jgi:HSP20 family protein
MEEMERMMDETFGRPMMWRRMPEEEIGWSPTMEIYEKDNNYVVRMELPGVKPEDVDISMSGDTLTVKGARNPPEDVKDEAYQLCEVCYGSFTRSITLPEAVDSDKIEANYDNGVLNLRIPKAEQAKTKQIKLTSSQSKQISGQSSMSSGESSSKTSSNQSQPKIKP